MVDQVDKIDQVDKVDTLGTHKLLMCAKSVFVRVSKKEYFEK